MGGGAHALKRIPRIKFPQRHPKPPSSSSDSSSQSTDEALKAFLSRSASGNSSLSVAGKASDQPKRVPMSNAEMEAIMLGGCI